MKFAIVLIGLFSAAWAFPKAQDLKFKRLYVDPVKEAPEDIISRIVNGVEATPHSIPYQIYLIATDGSESWLCGGSLISPGYVLTAGHCVDGGISANVYLGAHYFNEAQTGLVRIASSRLLAHPGYDGDTISNDIGIIKLATEAELNQYVGVVPIPSAQGASTYLGDNVRMSGWGLTEGNGDISSVLRQVNSTVISNADCNDIYGIVQDYQVCTSGTGGVGSCNGDSGGPLIDGDLLIGVVSYGVQNCLPGYPSAFTKVASFRSWIAENTDV